MKLSSACAAGVLLFATVPAFTQTTDLFVAHVASYRTLDSARSGLEDLQSRAASLLKDAKPHVHEVHLGSKGMWYRIQIGPPASEEAIKRLCANLTLIGHSYCKIMTAFEAGQTKPGHSGTLLLHPTGDGRRMEVVQQIEFVDSQGRRWTVPAGTKSDGASIPRALWSIVGSPFTGTYLKAAVIHDHYTSTKHRSWMDTHDNFYEVMVADGTDRKQALLMWAAVYRFGPRWAKSESMCWGTCAGSANIFVEDVTLVPDHSEADLRTIQLIVDSNAAWDRDALKKEIDNKAFNAGTARWKGSISRVDDNDKSKGIELVDEVAPINWMGLGEGNWTFKEHNYRVVNVRREDVLNLRSCPREDCETTAKVPWNATRLRRSGKCIGDWCPAHYGSTSGWVHRHFIAFDWGSSPQR